jgi:hypothetical protein
MLAAPLLAAKLNRHLQARSIFRTIPLGRQRHRAPPGRSARRLREPLTPQCIFPVEQKKSRPKARRPSTGSGRLCGSSWPSSSDEPQWMHIAPAPPVVPKSLCNHVFGHGGALSSSRSKLRFLSAVFPSIILPVAPLPRRIPSPTFASAVLFRMMLELLKTTMPFVLLFVVFDATRFPGALGLNIYMPCPFPFTRLFVTVLLFDLKETAIPAALLVQVLPLITFLLAPSRSIPTVKFCTVPPLILTSEAAVTRMPITPPPPVQ